MLILKFFLATCKVVLDFTLMQVFRLHLSPRLLCASILWPRHFIETTALIARACVGLQI